GGAHAAVEDRDFKARGHELEQQPVANETGASDEKRPRGSHRGRIARRSRGPQYALEQKVQSPVSWHRRCSRASELFQISSRDCSLRLPNGDGSRKLQNETSP